MRESEIHRDANRAIKVSVLVLRDGLGMDLSTVITKLGYAWQNLPSGHEWQLVKTNNPARKI